MSLIFCLANKRTKPRMNLLYRILLTLIMLLCIKASIFGAYYGYFDRYIKIALESYLSNQHLQITIGEFKTTAGIININKLLLSTNDNQ